MPQAERKRRGVSGRLLTTRAVAEMLAVSPETILRWHRSGKLPGGRRLSRNLLRFDRDELEEWLAATRREGPLVSVREEA